MDEQRRRTQVFCIKTPSKAAELHFPVHAIIVERLLQKQTEAGKTVSTINQRWHRRHYVEPCQQTTTTAEYHIEVAVIRPPTNDGHPNALVTSFWLSVGDLNDNGSNPTAPSARVSGPIGFGEETSLPFQEPHTDTILRCKFSGLGLVIRGKCKFNQ